MRPLNGVGRHVRGGDGEEAGAGAGALPAAPTRSLASPRRRRRGRAGGRCASAPGSSSGRPAPPGARSAAPAPAAPAACGGAAGGGAGAGDGAASRASSAASEPATRGWARCERRASPAEDRGRGPRRPVGSRGSALGSADERDHAAVFPGGGGERGVDSASGRDSHDAVEFEPETFVRSPVHSSPAASAIPGCCENAASASASGSSPPWVAQASRRGRRGHRRFAAAALPAGAGEEAGRRAGSRRCGR